MRMFTNHIHAYVIAMMYIIFVQYDALTILLLNVNHVANPFVVHGHSGHHGQSVQNHVVVEQNHVIEPLLGTMIEVSLKLKPTAVIQKLVRIGAHGSHGVHVQNHVTKSVKLNPSKTVIDVGLLMVSKIVALVLDMHIMIMMKELAI